MKKILISILFLLALPVAAYYNPGPPSGFVNDFAGVLDGAIKQALEPKLVSFEPETGNEISVVTVKNLDGDYIENFAEKLFKEWGIGKEKQDNGVLVLVAVEDRKMRIEVGYGLEGALTDAQSNWIINNELKPAFQQGDYSGGIAQAVATIIAATQGEYIPSADDRPIKIGNWFTEWFEIIFWFIIFGLMWLASILSRSKSWWAGGVIGGVIGAGIGLIKGFFWFGVGALAILIPLGFLFDYIVSKKYRAAKDTGRNLPWWFGGGGFGGGSHGGFGGFGGGVSGGGGSSGRWEEKFQN